MTFKTSLLSTYNHFRWEIALTTIIFMLLLLQMMLFYLLEIPFDLGREIDALTIIVIFVALAEFGRSFNNFILDFSFFLITTFIFLLIILASSAFLLQLLVFLLFLYGWYRHLLLFFQLDFLITSIGFLIVITVWSKNIQKNSHVVADKVDGSPTP
ncbi:hypothetical protein [Acidithiobacillus sulfurivorans]|uniref:Uncharacterized protein n=1 Tax=Acidithiobacillus sulfurivorans TaxID=1958756 RepID=A0ABS5ZXY4_9PROT|nr:hypothetical protein [Acidithiobacillus sulfurivorans]MBU2760029.1 hypothetical protein [Acidithiobacillus sulfurivorans]